MLVNECFAEFRYHNFKVKTLDGITDITADINSMCPACPKVSNEKENLSILVGVSL